MYVPEGYGTVFLYMIVNGAEDLADFLSEVSKRTKWAGRRWRMGSCSSFHG